MPRRGILIMFVNAVWHRPEVLGSCLGRRADSQQAGQVGKEGTKMPQVKWISCAVIAVVVCVCVLVPSASAAVVSTGDVSPPDPTTWTYYTFAAIGETGSGAVSVNGGDEIRSYLGYIGKEPGAVGEVTVSGPSSEWYNKCYIYAGFDGTGTLNIQNGGRVSTHGTSNYSVFIGCHSGSTGVITVDGAGSELVNNAHNTMYIGLHGSGILNISNGGWVGNGPYGNIGSYAGATGVVTVDGVGSTWVARSVFLGGTSYNGDKDGGNGKLIIRNGGEVSDRSAYIGFSPSSTGEVTVDGPGSTWTNSGNLYLGSFGDHDYGSATLNITNGGLVSALHLSIDVNDKGNCYVNMSTGGMLALFGDADVDSDGDITLAEFYAMINGTDAINYWDGSQWAPLAGATYGVDYTLSYLTEGDLAGYTMLTVPEPATLFVLAAGLVGIVRKRRSA